MWFIFIILLILLFAKTNAQINYAAINLQIMKFENDYKLYSFVR